MATSLEGFWWTLNLYHNETFYNILYYYYYYYLFFGGQKWGDIMFHQQHHREMLYIIEYLLRNGGLAWNKKVMDSINFCIFTLPWSSHSICSHSSSLIIIILLFTLVAFCSKLNPSSCLCLWNLGHTSHTPNNTPPKGILIIKGFIWKLPFCKVLMKQARGVKQISLFYFFSNLVCVLWFWTPKIFINLKFKKITLG